MHKGLFGSAVILAAAFSLVACGPSRSEEDAGFDAGFTPGPGGNDGGTTGDGGTGDAGTNPDGGTGDGGIQPGDGGVFEVEISDLRGPAVPFGSKVRLTDVVVTAVSFNLAGDAGMTGNEPPWRQEFWVTDPANPQQGIWVRKFYTDPPETGRLVEGDQVTIEGYFGTEGRFNDRSGYRRVVKSQNDFLPSAERPGLPMVITRTGTVSPPAPNQVTVGNFGNAEDGTARPNPEYAGGYVHIEGPLEITNPSPAAFKRVSENPNDSVYFGFEVTGGVLVNNYKTFQADGGCAWRDVALDAGTQGQKVVFQAVRGVWDSFTHAPCADGGTASNCFRNDGTVPGTTNQWTNVLYPQSCDDYVGGAVVDAE